MRNCDASKGLVRSFVASASNACPDPDFIIFTGDATRHVNPKKYIYNAFDFIHDLLKEYFPNISHFSLPPLILGNMDLDDNYLLDVTSLLPCLTDSNGALPRPSNGWLYNLSTYLRYKAVLTTWIPLDASKFPIYLTSYTLVLGGDVHLLDNTNVAQFKPLFSSLLR
jgi:hypothetical protein